MDLLHADRDKLLLTLVFVLLVFAIIHATHHGQADKELVGFLQQSAGTVLGGLMILLTGRANMRKSDNGNGGGK